ncbi:hypothetical protein D9M69_353940 [compost metagenome]
MDHVASTHGTAKLDQEPGTCRIFVKVVRLVNGNKHLTELRFVLLGKLEELLKVVKVDNVMLRTSFRLDSAQTVPVDLRGLEDSFDGLHPDIEDGVLRNHVDAGVSLQAMS